MNLLGSVPCFFSMGFSLLLGGILYYKRKDSPIFSPLILVMVVLTWIHGLNGISFFQQENLVFWKRLIVMGELTFPVVLGFVSQSLLKNISAKPDAYDWGYWRVVVGGAIILFFVFLIGQESVLQVNKHGEIVFYRPVGLAIWGFILISLVIGLSQLEQILRASKDPLRYQLKFVLIGLGGLAGISIAQASQLLLLPVWKQSFVWVGGSATFISLLLVAFGLGRWRVQDLSQKVQVSHHALYTSVSFLVVGGYLILVGLLSELIQQTGWKTGEAIGALVLFVACIGLVIVLFSRQARAELNQFLGRHFFRTRYDYREKWLEITETFTACQDGEAIWDRFLDCLSRTFGSPRVSIWKKFSVDGKFHQIRSLNTEHPPPPISDGHPLIQKMISAKSPFLLEEILHDDKDEKNLEEFLEVSQANICVPLIAEERLFGFCTLSKELHDRDFDHDDFDLLRAIAHHVTMLLVQFELIEERSSAAKWEAVHRFSGFYLHDLKNLASSLSMVVQNAEQYGNDPEFQESAMRTVRNTSQRIMDLMGKIARQSKGLAQGDKATVQPLDVNQLIQETLQGLNGSGCKPSFHPGLGLPLLHLQEDSIKQVVLNLILNARQAMKEEGTIDISTAYDDSSVTLTIVDSGPGMSPGQLEKLFQPFQSTKKSGLGVGLYQCKRMIEEHRGTIRVESQEGKGTSVSITFPAPTADT